MVSILEREFLAKTQRSAKLAELCACVKFLFFDVKQQEVSNCYVRAGLIAALVDAAISAYFDQYGNLFEREIIKPYCPEISVN